MITRSKAKWAGCLPLVFLLACTAITSADETLVTGWENCVPPQDQMPIAVSEGSSGGAASQSQTNPATLSAFNPLALVSGPSATAITPELQALASGLNNDPVKIFNYVRNKIVFQPYWGSNKGAQGTYLDGAGNDMDQASLLIALLNQAGYSATSYVSGKYTVKNTSPDGNDLAHWVGAPSSYAQNVLYSNYVQVYTGTNYGSYILWPFDHVWVRATINGTTYDLDPSYKMSQSFTGIDYKTASGYSRSQLVSDAGGTSTGDYAQNLSRASVESRLGQYSTALRNYINANNSSADIEQIVGGWRIQEQNITNLSQGAPPSSCSPTVTTTFSSVPSSYIATFRVQAGSIDSTFNADSLQGNRLSIVFSSNATQLWLGDSLVAQESNPSGTSVSVTLSLSHPSTSGFYTKTLNAASYLRSGSYDLSYSYFGNSRSTGQIDASNQRLQNYLASGLTDTSRQVTTETLHSLGLKWIRRVYLEASLTGQIRGCYAGVTNIFGRTGQESGYYVDMPGASSVIMNAQGADNIAFNAYSYLASAMEHGVIEQTGGSASVSTVRCLALANDGAQKIFRATSSNYSSTVSPALSNYGSGDLSTFSSLIGGGRTLLLHQNGATGLNQWKGYGYVSISGSNVGMIISGGYSGGYATIPVPASGVSTQQVNDISQNVASPTNTSSPPPNTAPAVSTEPVNLGSGAYTMEHTDLALGEQGSPRGLSFTRYYDSSRNFQASSLGNGWHHSCEGKVALSSEPDMAFGLTQPTDAAQTIMGVMTVCDFADTSYSAKELVLGALAANWTVNRITNNVANVQLGNQYFAYISQPDGSWNSPPGATTTLTGSNGTFTLLPRFGGSVVFDGSNRISQWKDVDNNTQTYAYTSGSLSTVTDKWGRTLTFTYNTSGVGNGLLKQVADSTGRSVQFAYTSGSYSGANLTGITDPETYQTTLVYDGRNRLTDWKDNANTTVTHNDYDSLDRVYQQLSQGLSTHTWKFLYSPGTTLEVDPQGGITAHLFDYKNRNAGTIDPLGNYSSIGYDSQNHVTQTVDATGRQTTSFYDSNQNLLTSAVTGTDSSVKTTTYQYDGSLRLWKVIDPTGRYTENGYDTKNHLTSVWDAGRRLTRYFPRADGLLDHVIDPAGNTISFTAYDSYGNSTNVTRGDGTTTSASYNARGDLLTSTDGRNNVTQYTCDKRRLPKTRTDARGKLTTWVYDSNGYLQSVTDRNNHTVSTPHDNLGHVQTMTATDTATVSYGYDTRDWQTTVTDGLGHTTTTNFDAAGRRSWVANPLTITTGSTAYDNAGRIAVQYDALNHATQYFYDGAGRLDHTLDPLNHTVYQTYDDAGRALTMQNQRGKTFVFGYGPTDGMPTSFTYPSGRQSQIIDREPGGLPKTLQSPGGNQTALTYEGMKRTKTCTDGVGPITWYYDGEGNATDVVETSGTTHRIFDELGRVTSCTDIQGNTVGYGYDNEGNITSITYPGNKTVSYTYDGSDRLKTVTDWSSRVTTYYYDTVGRLDHVDRPNNTRQRVIFDNANRLINDYEEKISGGTLWQAGYGYYNDNKLQSYTPSPIAKTYAPPSVTLTYDNDNRIATYNGQSVSHDLDGNLQSAPVQGTLLGALAWDRRNRLVNAGGITYTYDAENRRVSSITGGQTTKYICSRGASLDRLLVKQNPDGSTTRYVYGTGLLYEETTSATGVAQSPVYYHYNWRGDTIALSDASGNVTARLSYSPYGERTIESGTVTTPFCSNGKWGVMTEPDGLLSMQARYYSPILHRFLNEDPSGFTGGTNLYAYAGGDPLDLMDPFGLHPVDSFSSGFSEGFTLKNAAIGFGVGVALTFASPAVVTGAAIIGGAGLLYEGYKIATSDTPLHDTGQFLGATTSGGIGGGLGSVSTNLARTAITSAIAPTATTTVITVGNSSATMVVNNTIASVNIDFAQKPLGAFIATIGNTADSLGAKTVVVDTGYVINEDLAISLGKRAQSGQNFLGGTISVTEGGLTPRFSITIKTGKK